MDDDSRDTYVTQLKEVFISCDTTGSGCLNESELKLLCKKLHLTHQTDFLLYDLLQKNGGVEVKFEDFKNCFVALLSQTVSHDGESSVNEEPTDREISPKFILGRKKYGRRSRPASTVEGDDTLCLVLSEQDSVGQPSPLSNLATKLECGPGKRPVSPSYPLPPPIKSGRLINNNSGDYSIIKEATYHHQHNSNSHSEGNSYTENNPVEYLQQTWRKLKIGSDGYLTVDELALVCEHIGMDMTEEVVSQLFEKLDCDQDGRISFDEFVQGLFQHGEPQNRDSVTVKRKAALPLFKEQPTDEQISTTSISGLFSCLDVNNKGYADGSSILELWDSLEMPCSPQMLEDLGFSSRQKINLSDLSSVLEEEIMNSVTTPLGQLAFVTYQNELCYLRQCYEQVRTERNKLRENIEEANTRAALLAQEIDDNHAKLENTLQDKLLLAEKKYHEQVRELVEDLQQERENLLLQTNKFKQQLQSEIQSVLDEDSQLKNRLNQLEQENSRLELELQEVTDRWQEAEKQKEVLQKELAAVPNMKKRLAELESVHGEIQEHQHQSLLLDIENYKRINQELQDRIDELTLEIENLQQHTFVADAVSDNINRTHSWLSDYKKAAFKRRGSESSSEENSDDESPTIGKVRRTFLSYDENSSFESEFMLEKYADGDLMDRSPSDSMGSQPPPIDILLRDMFVDREHLVKKLYNVEDLKQQAEFSNAHLQQKCKILTRLAYDAAKTAVA